MISCFVLSLERDYQISKRTALQRNGFAESFESELLVSSAFLRIVTDLWSRRDSQTMERKPTRPKSKASKADKPAWAWSKHPAIESNLLQRVSEALLQTCTTARRFADHWRKSRPSRRLASSRSERNRSRKTRSSSVETTTCDCIWATAHWMSKRRRFVGKSPSFKKERIADNASFRTVCSPDQEWIHWIKRAMSVGVIWERSVCVTRWNWRTLEKSGKETWTKWTKSSRAMWRRKEEWKKP